MRVSDTILISKISDMIYNNEKMTENEFFNNNIHDIVRNYNIDEDLIDYVVADLCTYYDY